MRSTTESISTTTTSAWSGTWCPSRPSDASATTAAARSPTRISTSTSRCGAKRSSTRSTSSSPCVGISFLSVLVFYLPSESGEKVSLCISIPAVAHCVRPAPSRDHPSDLAHRAPPRQVPPLHHGLGHTVRHVHHLCAQRQLPLAEHAQDVGLDAASVRPVPALSPVRRPTRQGRWWWGGGRRSGRRGVHAGRARAAGAAVPVRPGAVRRRQCGRRPAGAALRLSVRRRLLRAPRAAVHAARGQQTRLQGTERHHGRPHHRPAHEEQGHVWGRKSGRTAVIIK